MFCRQSTVPRCLKFILITCMGPKHKNVQTNPENQKIDTTLLLFYVDTRKIVKAIRGNGYCFVPKGGMFPIETIMLGVISSDL